MEPAISALACLVWQSHGMTHQGFNVIPQEKYRLKRRGQLQRKEKHQGVERAGMAIVPAHHASGNNAQDCRVPGEVSNTDSDNGTGNDVSGIVNTQVNARQAGYEYCPAQGKQAQPARDKIQAYDHRKISSGMIAGERT